MAYLKLTVLLAVICILTRTNVEASSRVLRETEVSQETGSLESQVKEQLMTTFDSIKKTMEELTSKINTGDIGMGIRNFTSMLENYAKKTAEQFSSISSGQASNTEANNEQETKE